MQYALAIFILNPNCSGWTNGRTGTAAYTIFGIQLKGRAYNSVRASLYKANGGRANQVPTNAYTQATKDAELIFISVGGETAAFQASLPCKGLYNCRLWTAGQHKFKHHPANASGPLSFCIDHQSFLNWVGTGSHHFRLPI
jgi:hypothetical protein